MDSSSIIVTPQAQGFAKDISVKPAAEQQNAPNITQKGPDPQPISQATGAPDLAPGQKPDPKKQPSIYGEIPQIPVLDAVEGIKFDFNHGIRDSRAERQELPCDVHGHRHGHHPVQRGHRAGRVHHQRQEILHPVPPHHP